MGQQGRTRSNETSHWKIGHVSAPDDFEIKTFSLLICRFLYSWADDYRGHFLYSTSDDLWNWSKITDMPKFGVIFVSYGYWPLAFWTKIWLGEPMEHVAELYVPNLLPDDYTFEGDEIEPLPRLASLSSHTTLKRFACERQQRHELHCNSHSYCTSGYHSTMAILTCDMYTKPIHR